MKPEHKFDSPDDYDRVVCAEIPDPERYPQMHKLVKNHMIHGPCGALKEDSSCMEGDPKSCRFRYPGQFNVQTIQGEDAYPLYRRRNNGITVTVNRHILDNRWVAPYNPKLLMMFNCHINVEVCSIIKSVKYIFKYVYKGHDKQMIHVDGEDVEVINEIRTFQDARYVSPPEAIWRVFGFDLTQTHPPVMALQIHLSNEHQVRFREDDIMEDIVARGRDKRTMLTAFFDCNREYPHARQYLYRDFPKHFTWDNRRGRWNPRKQRTQVGRLVESYPSEGERYYLRVLLCHVKGPASYKDLFTYNGVVYSTFRRSAVERGLIESDNHLMECLAEASLFHFPSGLRTLFSTILIFCEPGNVRRLWDAHYEALSEDYRNEYDNTERVLNMVLTDIRRLVQSMGKKFDLFDLPRINVHVNVQTHRFRDVQEELAIGVSEEDLHARNLLNDDQMAAFNIIMSQVQQNRPGVFFIDGPGGTGKTFLYKALLADVRARGQVAVATASSGVAANNMPRGRTSHSRFGIPMNLHHNSICNIGRQTGKEELLREAKLIIWDEASLARRQAVEAVSRTMQDIMGDDRPFGGKVMVLGVIFGKCFPL